jgi:hypothetical protein
LLGIIPTKAARQEGTYDVIHVPPLKFISDIIKKVYWWAKSKIFWESILASHRHWQSRRGIGSRWESIGEGIEYSQSLARWPEGPEQSKIALRTTNGKTYNSVTLTVETVGGKYIHDETKILTDIGATPRITTLSGWPVYRLFVSEGRISSSYDTYQIRITRLVENNQSRSVDFYTPSFTPPIDQTITNHDDWIGWAGKPVNIALIRDQQENLKKRIWRKVGYPQMGVGWKHSGQNFLMYGMSSVLLSPAFVRTAYWLLLFVGYRKFENAQEDDEC